MFRWPKLALFLGTLAALGLGTPAARAQSCLSADAARNALQTGQVVPLSQLRGQIVGEIVGMAQLCMSGGRYVYIVNVLSRSGQVTRLTLDATAT